MFANLLVINWIVLSSMQSKIDEKSKKKKRKKRKKKKEEEELGVGGGLYFTVGKFAQSEL